MRVVYVDVLFCLNLILNYFLLLLTSKLGGVYSPRLRLLCGAAAGAFFSVLLYFPALPAPLAIAAKALVCAGIIAISFGKEPPRAIFRLSLVFIAISFAFAGGVVAVSYIFGQSGVHLSNGVPYFNLSLKLLLCAAAVSYCVLGLALGGGGMGIRRKNVTLEIFNKGSSVKLKGFIDSGNLLKDPITDRKSTRLNSSH